MTTSTTTERELCDSCECEITTADYEAGACTNCGHELEARAMSERYSITSARYAKKSIAVHCTSDGSGFKTLEMHAAESIGGRWSNREKAYILPATKEARLRQLLVEQRAAKEG